MPLIMNMKKEVIRLYFCMSSNLVVILLHVPAPYIPVPPTRQGLTQGQ